MEEELFLGLRKTEGVSKDTFLQKFGLRLDAIFQKQIEEQTRLGLIEETTEAIRLTRKGKLLGNEVFQSFLIDES
jgi:oxygen-independent coproporphyrinogen-3 oxidase